jgi:outer membrane protein TolC
MRSNQLVLESGEAPDLQAGACDALRELFPARPADGRGLGPAGRERPLIPSPLRDDFSGRSLEGALTGRPHPAGLKARPLPTGNLAKATGAVLVWFVFGMAGVRAQTTGPAAPVVASEQDGAKSREQEPVPSTEPAEPQVQLAEPGGAAQTGPPLTLTLQDALERARQNDAGYLSAVTDARNAHEDRIQARAALLPSVSTTTQELLTTGASVLSTGKFVTNDGVHVYRAWGVFHEDLSPNLFTLNGYKRASSAESLAKAREEISRRGLAVTVTQAYYDLVIAQRKYATAQQAAGQAQQFLTSTQEQESAGEVAHSDVVKAQIQSEQQQQSLEEARLAMENARLNLAVILFPTFNENFTVVDDLDQAPALPSFEETRQMAVRDNPDLKVAIESLREADLDVSASRNTFLPSVSVDEDYGIEANVFALRGKASGAAGTDKGDQVQNNLGNFITANLQLPVWDWGAMRSKLHQTEWRRQQARVQLSLTQRKMVSSLYSSYNEAATAHAAADRLRRAAELASESLRLTALRYSTGEATALEVVDAQNTLTQARNAYDDAGARYRLALAELQTLTGSF